MTLARQCIMLFWLQVKMRLGLSAMKFYFKRDKKKFNMNIFILVAVLYSYGMMLFMYGSIYRALVQSALELGLGSLMIAATILLAMIMSLFFGTFQLNAAVFNAKDIEWYAPLPLKPEAVFFAKFGYVYLIELATSFLILAPSYVLYAAEVGAGIGFWLLAVLTLPLVPIIPLALSALLSLPLSKFSAKFRNRELIMTVLTGVFVIAIALGSMLLSGTMGRVMTGDISMLENVFINAEPVLRTVTSIFPPAMWLALGLTFAQDALSSILLFLAVSVAIMTAMIYLAGKFYYAGVLAILETPPAKRKNNKVKSTAAQATSPVIALAVSDLKVLLRTPVYLINSLSGMFFGAMVFIMPLALGSEWDAFKKIIIDALNNASPAFVLAVMTLILSAAGMVNPAASTAFSRDGRSIWLMQTIPVTPKMQVLAKIVSSTTITAISAVIIAVCVCSIFPQLIPFAVMGLVPALFTVVAASAMSMLPDIISPKLKWDNEAEAMKQNFNSLWGMLTMLPVALIMAGILGVIAITDTQSATVALIVLLLVSAGLAFGAIYIANKIAEPRFRARGERL